MRIIALLVAKDLRKRFRAPFGLVVMLSFPVIFAGMIALVFGRQGEAVPRVRLIVENLDGDTFLAGGVVSSLTSTQMARYFDVRVVRSEGVKILEAGEASALLRIPQGFSRAIVDGTPVSLSLVRNPAEGILPEIAEQSARMLAEVLDGGARVLRGPLEQLRPFLDEAAPSVTAEGVSRISLDVFHAIEEAGPLVRPPAITLEGAFDMVATGSTSGKGEGSMAEIFLFILPGVAVYALFFVGDQGMRDLLTERKEGTLKRLMAGPIDMRTLLLAKGAYAAVLSLLGIAVLAVVGAAAGGSAADPLGFLVLSLALVVAVTGAAATVYGLARSERQGATLSSLVYLFLAFAGGSFLPLRSLPASVRAVAPLSPFYWGTQGYQALLTGEAGVADILPHAAVLALLGVLLLALGAATLGRTIRSGVSE